MLPDSSNSQGQVVAVTQLLATGHRVLCQQFWDGDLPGLFGPETAACLIELGAAPLSPAPSPWSGGGEYTEAQAHRGLHAPGTRINSPDAKDFLSASRAS